MKFVFLGDYVDRGPDSKGVIEFLINLRATTPAQVICLMGNHESMMLAAAGDAAHHEHWLHNGGSQTLESYRLRNVTNLPYRHFNWLQSLLKFHDDGLRFFVHAGVNPAKPLDQQDQHDLFWIREPFLSSTKDFGRLAVHGHTPLASGKPEQRLNRLNLDTGAVYGRALTAAVFNDENVLPLRFLASG